MANRPAGSTAGVPPAYAGWQYLPISTHPISSSMRCSGWPTACRLASKMRSKKALNTYRVADHKEKAIELLMRVTRVSAETMEIVAAMKAIAT